MSKHVSQHKIVTQENQLILFFRFFFRTKQQDLQLIVELEKSLKEELDQISAVKLAKLKTIEQLKDDIKRDTNK
jgi:hypothetical protein